MNKKLQVTSYKLQVRKGFTLIELLVVIAIIGILSSVVLVSSRAGVDKAKRASALTTVSSVLTELAVCGDDGGEVLLGNIPAAGGGTICCTNNTCATAQPGHTVTWPSLTNVGWQYRAGGKSGTLAAGNLIFIIENTLDTTQFITCDLANSNCT